MSLRCCFFSPVMELKTDKATVIPALMLRISLVSSSRLLLRSAIRCAAQAPANAPAKAPTNDVVNDEFEKDFMLSHIGSLEENSIKKSILDLIIYSAANIWSTS